MRAAYAALGTPGRRWGRRRRGPIRVSLPFATPASAA